MLSFSSVCAVSAAQLADKTSCVLFTLTQFKMKKVVFFIKKDITPLKLQVDRSL